MLFFWDTLANELSNEKCKFDLKLKFLTIMILESSMWKCAICAVKFLNITREIAFEAIVKTFKNMANNIAKE